MMGRGKTDRRWALALLLLVIGGVGAYLLLEETTLTDGGIGMEMTIHYADGSTRTVSPIGRPLSTWRPMKISDTGGVVSKVVIKVKMKPVFTGELRDFDLKGSTVVVRSVYQKYGTTTSEETWIHDEMTLPGELRSGEWHTILEIELTSDKLEEMWVGEHGNYKLEVEADITLRLNFAKEPDVWPEKTSTGEAAWYFTYSPDVGFTSLSISVGVESF